MNKLLLAFLLLLCGCIVKDWDDGTVKGICDPPKSWHYCNYTIRSTCGCGEYRGASYICAIDGPGASGLLQGELDLVGTTFATTPVKVDCKNTGMTGREPGFRPFTEGGGPQPDPLPDMLPENQCCE